MEKIKKGIVFSNDIEYILNGKNALDFSYSNNGIVIPDNAFIKKLRDDFKKQVEQIFNGQVVILSEEEMFYSLNSLVQNIIGIYPHRYVG